MADFFTREQIRQFLIVFCFYDFDGDSKIETTDLRHVLHDLNRNPSEEELQDLMEDADPDDTGTIGLREFLYVMVRIVEEERNEAEREQRKHRNRRFG